MSVSISIICDQIDEIGVILKSSLNTPFCRCMYLHLYLHFFCRCFTFGIGSGASSALVNGMAKAGRGTAEFVKEGERMQPKVRFFHAPNLWNDTVFLTMYTTHI